ncbi:MAG: dihydroxyacetone kinase subunit DhaK, partial [Firmicutes bacterium]|nr:dihydroxyacetone kinase subunit DhaK [Bacillota bacterium]
TTTIRVMDDVASAPKDRIEDRRGIAGDLFVIKVAGAACHAGLSLDEVTRITRKARDNVRTMGVAVSPGTIPGVDEPTFQLADDEMEIGMGLHGEPGVRRGKMRSDDELVDELLDLIIEDLPFVENDEVCILVNGYGSTTRMELYICMRRVLQELDRRNVRVYDHELGNYATCQEMAGVSVSLMRLDEELKTYYSFPAWSPGFYKKS